MGITSSEAAQPAQIESWARQIEAWGLSPIAVALVEAIRPFGPLGSMALLMAQPLLTGLVADGAIQQIATLLDDPDLLNQLSARLDRGEVK